MDDRERIDLLEVRLARLEAELVSLKRSLKAGAPGAAGAAATPRAARDAAFRPARRKSEGAGPAHGAGSRLAAARQRIGHDAEAWLGENALLVVGILALVATVGFALKYAFDQGWISPAVRVLAGIVVGLAVQLWGTRLHRRGLRTYGAAAIGAGAAIMYLAVWAAAGPYRFIPAGAGIGALALLSGAVLASAWRSGEEYLAALAAVGAYIAPVLLGRGGSPDLLLAYGGLVSVAAGGAAVARRWGSTFTAVLAGFFLMAVVSAPDDPDLALIALYLAGGGGAAVLGARWRTWRGAELLAWLPAWVGLALGSVSVSGWRGWTYVVLPGLLVAPGWLAIARGFVGTDRRQDTEVALFGASAAAWAGVAMAAVPPPAYDIPLVVVGAIGLLYALPGVAMRNGLLLAGGLLVVALAASGQWDGTGMGVTWAALALVAAVATRRGPLTSARWTVAALGGAAALRLLGVDLDLRPAAEPAFLGNWFLAAAGLTAVLAIAAGPLWGAPERRHGHPGGIDLRLVTWVLAGITLLVGGTAEIERAFAQSAGPGADFAAGLAVSAFWLLYAGALLAYGFAADRRAVRIAGLVVASLAVGKVVFVDLATLRALYRVASFGLLAAIALAGALAYHRRRDGASRSGVPSPEA